MARGRGLADSLRAGVPVDSLAARLGGWNDTGLFEIAASGIPGIGRTPGVLSELARADSDTTVRVLGPMLAEGAVVVGEIVERQPRTVPPLAEVLPEVKRRADAEKRRQTHDAELHAYYQAHAASYLKTRATVARVVLPDSVISIRTPSAHDVERWYSRHGASLAPADSGGAPPPLSDSLRRVVAMRIADEEYAKRAGRALEHVTRRWSGARDLAALARRERASADTVGFVAPATRDPIFPAALVDSLLSGAEAPGTVAGPRRFGARTVAWSVIDRDTAYLPPFGELRSQVESAVQQERRQRDEAEGRSYFEAHRDDFKTPPRYVIDYLKVEIPSPDSLKIPETEVRGFYDQHLDRYRQEEQVRARHILISTRPDQTPGGEPVARARADSLLAALRAGADFAELARRFSQDPGSATAGGELGFFPRGRMVPAFSDTAFALEPGRVSQPVKTRFGYHLIQVEERKPAGQRSFAEVESEIHHELGVERADSLAQLEANRLRRRLVRGADPAKVAAGGLTTSPPFAENEPVPELGYVPGLGQELKTLKPGHWGSRVYHAGGAYVIARLARRVPPGPAEFDEVRAQTIAAAQNAKKRVVLDRQEAEIRAALAAGASLDSIAVLHGGLKDSGLLTRASSFVPGVGRDPRIVERAFRLEPGTVSDTLATGQGVAWIRVEERKPREGASFTKDRAALEQELEAAAYKDWLERRKASMKIEILRADLREEPAPIQRTITLGGGGR